METGNSFADALMAAMLDNDPSFDQVVMPDQALRIAAVFCAVRVVSEDLAQLPLKLFRTTENGLEQAKDNPLYNLIRWQPNDWQTAYDFIESMTIRAMLTGDAIALIQKDEKGNITELLPVTSGFDVLQNDHWIVSYVVTINGERKIYPKNRIFHLKGPSSSGLKGLSVVRMAGKALGLSRGLETLQQRYNKKSGRSDGLVTTDEPLSPDEVKNIREQLDRAYGPDGDGGTSVLDRGLKYMRMAMTAQETQQIENRRFAIEEIARFFRVLPIMLMQAAETTTYASAESFFQHHVKNTLNPWIIRWEQALKRDLLGRNSNYYFKFQLQSLLRGDAKTRAKFYRDGIESGWLTRNQVREMEEMNPLSGLDEPIQPLNMGGVRKEDEKEGGYESDSA